MKWLKVIAVFPLTLIGLLFWVSLLAENTNVNDGSILALVILSIIASAYSVKYSITRNIY
jgi:ABC-type microcin C transport system permease subunit YejB